MARERDLVAVEGPDARSYLQGQLSQDVDTLEVGGSRYTFLLQPNGKVDAWLRVARRGGESYILDVEAGWGELVVGRLERFLLRTACTVGILDWGMATVLGTCDVPAPAGCVAMPVSWPGLEATDVIGEPGDLAAGTGWLPPEASSGERWEYLRVVAGIPAMGSEIDGDTIPAATGQVERSVDFSKGCYTGQELVARMDSRAAGPPSRLVRASGAGEPPPPGAAIEVGGDEAGYLTSVEADGSGFMGLGYLGRRQGVPVDAIAAWPGGRIGLRLAAA